MRSVLIIVLTIVSSSAFGEDVQNQAPDNRCWFGSASFTQGAPMRAGDQIFVCNSGGAWVESKTQAANCIYGDKFYTVGAAVDVGKQALIECQPDGTWRVRK